MVQNLRLVEAHQHILWKALSSIWLQDILNPARFRKPGRLKMPATLKSPTNPFLTEDQLTHQNTKNKKPIGHLRSSVRNSFHLCPFSSMIHRQRTNLLFDSMVRYHKLPCNPQHIYNILHRFIPHGRQSISNESFKSFEQPHNEP